MLTARDLFRADSDVAMVSAAGSGSKQFTGQSAITVETVS
jgi:hypothetical protein